MSNSTSSEEDKILQEDMELSYKRGVSRSNSMDSLKSLEDEAHEAVVVGSGLGDSASETGSPLGAGSAQVGGESSIRARGRVTGASSGSGAGGSEMTGVQRAITRKKELFVLPETRDCLERVLDVAHWSLSEYIRVTVAIGLVLNAVFGPGWLVIVSYVFWRVAYDGFLGILLRNQSRRRSLSKAWQSLRARVDSGSGSSLDQFVFSFASRLVVGTMNGSPRYRGPGGPFELDSVPNDCQAWLVFRELVDFILNADAVAHIVFCLRFFEAPEVFGFWALLRYLVGVALIALSFWAKHDALRVIKDFAWCWGDFFHLLTEVELKFDGVFEMFPHPMYTVGYGFYYGLALMSHSYTVLYVSMWGHLMQLMFLALVETPHIERTYGSSQPATRAPDLEDFFSQDLIVLMNLNPMRALDLATIVCMGYTASLSLFGFSNTFYILLALFWRVVHVGAVSGILAAQSASNWWVRQSEARGLSLVQAFGNWKQIYNLSLVLAHTSFAVAALCVRWSADDYTFGPLLFRAPIAVLLAAINLWSARSSLDALGEYGWFYGDFFVRSQAEASDLEYTGIYRFLNNPDIVTGYFGYYGLAILSNEPAVVFIAMFSQLTHWLFVIFVEKPHMQKLYGDSERDSGGIEKHLRKATFHLLGKRRPIRKLISHPLARKVSESAARLASSTSDFSRNSFSELSSSARVISGYAKDLIEKTTDNAKHLKSKILPDPIDSDDDAEPSTIAAAPSPLGVKEE